MPATMVLPDAIDPAALDALHDDPTAWREASDFEVLAAWLSGDPPAATATLAHPGARGRA